MMKARSIETWLLGLLLVSSIPNTTYGMEVKTSLNQEQMSSLLTKFEQYAKETQQTWKVPGMAIAIVVDDRMVYAKGFGVKQVGGTDPVDPQTIFQIGSTSKAFTSALVAMQVDAGKMQWTDRVVDHLPDFMMYDPWVTREFQVWDLMAQHSGLAAYSGDLQAFVGYDRQHIIHSLRYIQPVSSFRTKFAYVNNLFLVAAALVEQQTDLTWEENVQKRIFDPLGMTESTMGLQAFQQTSNLATPHTLSGEEIIPLGKDWPFQNWVYTYGPAGGINSNVVDMSKWLQLHIGRGTFAGKKLISTDNIEFVHAPKTIIRAGEQAVQAQNQPLLGSGPLLGTGTYYAQGWIYIYDNPYPIVWHNGGTSGCKTVVAFVPEAGVGIVVLSNLDNTQVPEILAQWFFDHYFGTSDKDWNQIVLEQTQKAAKEKPPQSQQQSSPALPLSAYAGTYHNDVYGDVIVTPENGTLTMTIGPDKVKSLLEHQDRDTFVLTIPQAYDFNILATFDLVSDKAETLTIDMFKQEGSGVFQRVK